MKLRKRKRKKTTLDVRGEVVEDHLAVDGFPVCGVGFCVVAGGRVKAAVHAYLGLLSLLGTFDAQKYASGSTAGML